MEKPDLDKLLYTEDINKSIIAFHDYVAHIMNDEEDMGLSLVQREFLFNQEMEMDVNNGGLELYFTNSPGEFAHEAVNSLRVIGANITADILQSAIDQFPDKTVPKERTLREEIVANFDPKALAVLEELTQRFFLYQDDLNQLNIDYLKKNKDVFWK